MSRPARLARLTQALRGGGATTIEALARELEVSARTIRRDLSTLRAEGHVVRGEPGPGGGVRLDSERGVTSVHLTLQEAVTLWLSARLAHAQGTLPWASAADTALTKVLSSLPLDRARALTAVCRRVIVGPPPTASMLADVRRAPAEALAVFEHAFTTRTALAFDYERRSGRRTHRRVEPHGLLVQSPLWYVLGVDLDARAPRMFRMDRISHMRAQRDVSFSPSITVIEALLEPGFEWRTLLGARTVAARGPLAQRTD